MDADKLLFAEYLQNCDQLFDENKFKEALDLLNKYKVKVIN